MVTARSWESLSSKDGVSRKVTPEEVGSFYGTLYFFIMIIIIIIIPGAKDS